MGDSTPVVLVHGNPETVALWGPLLEHLPDVATVRLSPPGFGADAEPHFTASVEEYVAWMTHEIDQFNQPVHLLGHDWGGVLTVLLAMRRPDLLRSWASDCLGVFDQDYTFHPLAQEWQTPGEGEEAVARQFGGDLAARIGVLREFGVPASMADVLAADQVPSLRQVVLPLYRSIAQPVMADYGADLCSAAAKPGLSILAESDSVLGSESSRLRAAALAQAETVRIPGAGHWWMLDEPETAAAALVRFWAQSDSL